MGSKMVRDLNLCFHISKVADLDSVALPKVKMKTFGLGTFVILNQNVFGLNLVQDFCCSVYLSDSSIKKGKIPNRNLKNVLKQHLCNKHLLEK